VPVDKSLAATLAEIKEELKTFIQTRAEIFKTETAEKMRVWKRSVGLLALAAVFLLTFWSTFVFSLVALLHSLLISANYEWFWGGLIVSGVFLLLAGLPVKSAINSSSLAGLCLHAPCAFSGRTGTGSRMKRGRHDFSSSPQCHGRA